MWRHALRLFTHYMQSSLVELCMLFCVEVRVLRAGFKSIPDFFSVRTATITWQFELYKLHARAGIMHEDVRVSGFRVWPITWHQKGTWWRFHATGARSVNNAAWTCRVQISKTTKYFTFLHFTSLGIYGKQKQPLMWNYSSFLIFEKKRWCLL